MKPRLIVMVGVPGCGKTTYVRAHLGRALRISLDDIRLMLSGRAYYQRYEPIVVAVAEAALRTLLARAAVWHRDVLLDATNATRRVRKRYLQMARAHGVSPVAVFVTCPLMVALERDAARPNPVGREVVEHFQRALQPPTLAEGFEDVIHVDGVEATFNHNIPVPP